MIPTRAGRAGAVVAVVTEAVRLGIGAGADGVMVAARLGAAMGVGYWAGHRLARAASRLAETARGPSWWATLATAVALGLAGVVRSSIWPQLPVAAVVAGALVLLCVALAVPSWRRGEPVSRLSTLFLASGFSALVYQITWQRALLTSFGVNIESVTVVVSLFMVGLGVGAALGGWLSRSRLERLPWIFMGAELGIGLFGVISIPVIEAAGEQFIHLRVAGLSGVAYLLLGFPTLLMGATLPVLVAYVLREHANAGVSVSVLYALNAAGAALACLVTTDLLLGAVGLRATTWIAAGVNGLVAWLAWIVARDGRGLAARSAWLRPSKTGEGTLSQGARLAGIALAMVVAWISLSQEILWVRAVGYATGSDPRSFGHVLGAFLVGLAMASTVAVRISRRTRRDALFAVGVMLLLSGPIYAGSIPVVSWLGVWDPGVGHLAMLLAIGLVAFLLGGAFPLLCRYVVTDEARAGSQVAAVYVANIVGATCGPLVTGFVLLDLAPLRHNVLGLAVVTTAVGLVVTLGTAARRALTGLGGAVAAGAIAVFASTWDGVLERLHFGQRYGPEAGYSRVVENRSGIIALHAGRTDPEHPGDSTVIYGGGAYDGRLAVDPVANENRITRAYMASVLHPRPKRVAFIGLGGGAWARAILANPAVQEAVIVEINPGYEVLLAEDPLMAPLLDDPRVTLLADDGRRWLRRNEGEMFDMVVTNTTFHRRSFAANLLSREFFAEVRGHLNPGGLLVVNPTGARSVARTAAQVFEFVAWVEVALVMGPGPPGEQTSRSRMDALRTYEIEGEPVFVPGEPSEAVAAHLASRTITNVAAQVRNDPSLRVFTDDNLGAEYDRF